MLAPWLLILALWYAIRASGLVSPALVPAPHLVFTKAVELAGDRLWRDIYISTQRVVIGVTLGVALAVPVGFCLGWYQGLRSFIDPVINFFRALPPIALIPLVIVYFGIGELAKTVILFYAAFFAGVIVMYDLHQGRANPGRQRLRNLPQGHHSAGRAPHPDGGARRAGRGLGDAGRV